jgi:membrane-associated phospholipid phosphatase
MTTERDPQEDVRASSGSSDMQFERRLLLASGAFMAAAVPVAVIAYAATHAWAPLHDLDSAVATNLNVWAVTEPGAVAFLKGVSDVLDPWTLRAAAVVAVVVLFARRQRRLALWAATTVLVGSLLGFTIKLVVSRSRPSLPDAVDEAIGYSFPSGHALNSFVIIGVLALLAVPLVARRWRPFVWAVAAAAVGLVGFARVGLGVHYVSDVVAGWLLGAGLIAATVVAFDTWRRPRSRRAAEVLSEGVDPAGSQAAMGPSGRENVRSREVS